jgi:hypothetical protein
MLRTPEKLEQFLSTSGVTRRHPNPSPLWPLKGHAVIYLLDKKWEIRKPLPTMASGYQAGKRAPQTPLNKGNKPVPWLKALQPSPEGESGRYQAWLSPRRFGPLATGNMYMLMIIVYI